MEAGSPSSDTSMQQPFAAPQAPMYDTAVQRQPKRPTVGDPRPGKLRRSRLDEEYAPRTLVGSIMQTTPTEATASQSHRARDEEHSSDSENSYQVSPVSHHRGKATFGTGHQSDPISSSVRADGHMPSTSRPDDGADEITIITSNCWPTGTDNSTHERQSFSATATSHPNKDQDGASPGDGERIFTTSNRTNASPATTGHSDAQRRSAAAEAAAAVEAPQSTVAVSSIYKEERQRLAEPGKCEGVCHRKRPSRWYTPERTTRKSSTVKCFACRLWAKRPKAIASPDFETWAKDNTQSIIKSMLKRRPECGITQADSDKAVSFLLRRFKKMSPSTSLSGPGSSSQRHRKKRSSTQPNPRTSAALASTGPRTRGQPRKDYQAMHMTGVDDVEPPTTHDHVGGQAGAEPIESEAAGDSLEVTELLNPQNEGNAQTKLTTSLTEIQQAIRAIHTLGGDQITEEPDWSAIASLIVEIASLITFCVTKDGARGAADDGAHVTVEKVLDSLATAITMVEHLDDEKACARLLEHLGRNDLMAKVKFQCAWLERTMSFHARTLKIL